MDSPATAKRRCIIWFGQPSPRERSMLAATGWDLREVDPRADAHVGMRGGDKVVALVDLREVTGEVVQALQRTVVDHADLPLIALPPESDADDQALQPILQACGERLVSPFNPQQLAQALAAFDQRAPSGEPVGGMIGQSPPMLEVRATLHRYAGVDLPVLVTGETGTGKELAARALHDLSDRRRAPFVAVNCGALPSGLIQAELFGHERGAFTGAAARRIGLFETANTGTIFLDEIGDLPLDAQANLLRVLQEGTLERVGNSQSLRVDVRVLAATHVDLEQAVSRGHFRRDLYFRLDVLHLDMPPLRTRGADVELLARRFLEEFRKQHTVTARGFDSGARRALGDYHWPGNVRELLNRVRRAAVIARQPLISADDLQLSAAEAPTDACLDSARTSAERETVLATLRETGFNVSACARRLQVSRVTVYRLCKKHRLSLADLR